MVVGQFADPGDPCIHLSAVLSVIYENRRETKAIFRPAYGFEMREMELA